MKVELLSVPLGFSCFEECKDTKVIACFEDFCLLEEIIFDIAGVCRCNLPCDWDGWVALCEDDLNYIVDEMTPELGTDIAVDMLCEACRQAKQHLRDGRLVYAYLE